MLILEALLPIAMTYGPSIVRDAGKIDDDTLLAFTNELNQVKEKGDRKNNKFSNNHYTQSEALKNFVDTLAPFSSDDNLQILIKKLKALNVSSNITSQLIETLQSRLSASQKSEVGVTATFEKSGTQTTSPTPPENAKKLIQLLKSTYHKYDSLLLIETALKSDSKNVLDQLTMLEQCLNPPPSRFGKFFDKKITLESHQKQLLEQSITTLKTVIKSPADIILSGGSLEDEHPIMHYTHLISHYADVNERLMNENKLLGSSLFTGIHEDLKAKLNELIIKLKKLIPLSQHPEVEAITDNNFAIFSLAAENGNGDLVDKLFLTIKERAPHLIENMFQADNFAAFRLAAAGGHLNVINRLLELAPNQIFNMMTAYDFYAFRSAAAGGHLNVMNRLLELAPDQIFNMMTARDFYAFRLAGLNGHLNVMNRLLELAPDQIAKMIAALNFAAFHLSAEGGHLHVMNKLIELDPDQINNMIEAENFYAFRKAAKGGHLHVMNRLIELAPDQINNMIVSWHPI